MPEPLLSPDRFFSPDPGQRRVARELYDSIAGLPIVSPARPRRSHAVGRRKRDLRHARRPVHHPRPLRVPHALLPGRPPGGVGHPAAATGAPVETDHRKIWQTFADHFYLFRGTPSGVWLAHELYEIFGIQQKLTGATAQATYDELADKLATPEYRPRALFERFKIEVLCTTDGAADSLEYHKKITGIGVEGGRPAHLPTRCGHEPRAAGLESEPRCAERSRRPGNHHGQGAHHRARGAAGLLQEAWAPPPPTAASRPRTPRRCLPPMPRRSSPARWPARRRPRTRGASRATWRSRWRA